MLLRRGHQRLNDIDVALSTVGQQLRLDAVVAEPLDHRVGQRDSQMSADVVRESGMSASGVHGHVTHESASWVFTHVGRSLTRSPVSRPGYANGAEGGGALARRDG